jgi:pimeloyl-ACP methyl ester carboxylesterase
MTTGNKPTIVLVHGAFAESSSWNGVIDRLLAEGYPVISAANPLRGVKLDADYVCNLLRGIQGDVVLVGHSYGGMVITNAIDGSRPVKALVYVAAFAPEVGESAVDLSGKFPGSTLGPTLSPIPLPDGTNDLYIQGDKFHAQFAADVPEAEAKRMAATQRPITDAALAEGSGAAPWKTIPSWVVYGELDKNIPAAAIRFMGVRANAREIVEVKGASHVVMVSNPAAVAQVIINAATAS